MLAKEPTNIINLFTNEVDWRSIFTLLVVYVVPVLPYLLPGKLICLKSPFLSDMSFIFLFTNCLFFLSGSDVAQGRPHCIEGAGGIYGCPGSGEEEEEANCQRWPVRAEALEKGAPG